MLFLEGETIVLGYLLFNRSQSCLIFPFSSFLLLLSPLPPFFFLPPFIFLSALLLMLPNGLLYTRNSKYRADWGSGVWRGGWGSYSPAINELSREQMKATRQLWQMRSQRPCQVRMGARAGVGGKRRVPFALGRGSFH